MAKNQSLERGLAILNLLDSTLEPLGVREVARRLELSPTIVQRLISTLADGGFVAQDTESLHYRLDYRALSLGASLLHGDNLIAGTLPELRRLADTHMLNGFLAIETGGRLVYALTVQSSGPITIRARSGTTAHFHSTAMGKALLAGLPEEEARRLLGDQSLPKLTDKTVTDPDRVIAELALIRRQGYAESKEENLPGIVAVAAGVRNETGRTVAAISVAFAPNTAPGRDFSGVSRLVVEAAAAVSRRLGCPPDLLPRVQSTSKVGEDAA